MRRVLRRLLRRWIPTQYANGGYIPPVGGVPFLLDDDRVWIRRADGAWLEVRDPGALRYHER